MAESPNITGVEGPSGLKRLLRVYLTAINKGWNIPADKRQEILSACYDVLANGESERDRMTAAKILVAANGQDIRLAEVALNAAKATAPAVVNNTQVNVYQTKALDSEDGRNALARLRDVIKGGDAPAIGTA